MSATAWIKELPSIAATREQALAQAPRLVTVLLLALLALQLAMTLTRQPGSTPLTGLGAAALPRPVATREVDLPAIVNAHLFGQKAAAPVSASDAPQSSMPLVLVGIYAVADPNRGMAIIGQTTTNARLVQVGGPISGGARLHAVYSDRVLIDRGGSLESVYLPKTLSSARPAPVSSAPQAATGGQRLQALAQNGTLLNGLVRLQAVTQQGKLMGFRVFPGGRSSAEVFGQLGLRAGDLITHINGTSLDDPNRASEVLQTLSNASTASVTISRNGQPTEVNLNLTAVAQAAEAAVAADSAAASSAATGPGAGFRGFAPATGGAFPGGGTAAPGGTGRPPARFNRGGNNSPNGN